MMIDQLPAPTQEQCSSGEIIECEGRRYLATWYPEIGGHGGMCWVDVSYDSECIDVAVWNITWFPFRAGDRPRVFHHCYDIAQYIRFGELVQKAKAGSR